MPRSWNSAVTSMARPRVSLGGAVTSSLALASCLLIACQHPIGAEEITYDSDGSDGGSAVHDCSCDATGGAAAGSDAGENGVGGEAAVEALLPAYYEFVTSLQERGFVFMDFGTFWQADKESLPEKLIVVRHDVHERDIGGAYCMAAIERALLPARSATYFVMLGFPPEADNADIQQQ